MKIKDLRFNEGKLRYDLVHPKAHEGMVKVLTKGAEKYAPRNWEKGMYWSKVIASLKRHLASIEKGEDVDSETGLLHADHLQCNAHFLSAYYDIAPHFDDRPIKSIQAPKIGLDIDEVLCDWVGGWNELHGIDKRPENWYFFKDIMNEFSKMEKEETINNFYLNLKPLIKPLDIPFEPDCYITSRPVSSEISEKWLYANGFPVRPVFTVSSEKSKLDYAKERGLDMFVDDGWHNFKQLNENGIFCYLMDAPHNRRYQVGHRRIESLNDINIFN